MGRGVLTGLIWGTIVGFGILTLANEIAAPISLTPVPAPAVVEDTPQAPEAGPESVGVAVTPDAPAAEPHRSGAEPEMQSPDVAEASPQVSEEAAEAPEIVQPEGLETPVPEEMGEVIAPESSPVLAPPQAMAPEAATPDSLPSAEEALPGAATLPEGADVAPPAPETPEVAPEASTPEITFDSADMEAAPEATLEEGPSAEAMPGQKAGSFTDREDSRISSRLPSISAPTPDETAPVVVAEDLPALLAYSANYTATPPGPVMSVVLMDIAELGPDDPQLANLPFPVTFAVDALAAGAGDRAMAYRDKGLEVMAMVGLPEGATPQDVAVTLSQAAALVPVSIGFLDVPSGSFQTSRQVAAQVVATAQDSGRGLVTFPRGLNALEQEAQRAKAPAALVFRDLDGQGQDVAAIKRFLDQAAFQAGTGKTVVLLGRSRAETLQALAEWSLGNRAATVTMVPLSYLLSRSQL
jgi:Uncharacterized protein conserved in bacteria